MRTTDSILVGFDIDGKNEDTAVLIVGKKNLNESVTIINAFKGEEAVELYNRLITKKEKENVSR